MNKNWYSIKNKAAGVLDISIHDEIGLWGFSAADFFKELRATEDVSVINLSIHSPGGAMIDGFAIYNGLKNHPAKVYAHIEGVAASMAGIIFMAGDVRTMPTNAFFMTHAPRGGAMGTADDLREVAEIMDKFRGSAESIFRNATDLSDDEIFNFLDNETWFNGEEALVKGFVHTLTDQVQIAANLNGFDKHFKSMPIENNQSIDNINTIKHFESFQRESGGVSRRVATALASRAKTIFRSESEPSNSATMNELSNALSRFKVPESL